MHGQLGKNVAEANAMYAGGAEGGSPGLRPGGPGAGMRGQLGGAGVPGAAPMHPGGPGVGMRGQLGGAGIAGSVPMYPGGPGGAGVAGSVPMYTGGPGGGPHDLPGLRNLPPWHTPSDLRLGGTGADMHGRLGRNVAEADALQGCPLPYPFQPFGPPLERGPWQSISGGMGGNEAPPSWLRATHPEGYRARAASGGMGGDLTPPPWLRAAHPR